MLNVINDPPLYNIGMVARLTGVPASTLRIWERRYRFPAAARSAGRQRLYTEHEIARLRWVKARTEAGMQVSQAVQALRRLEAEGRGLDALPFVRPAPANGQGPAPEPAQPATGPAAPSLDAVRERLSAALLAHDLEQADAVLNEAMTIYTPERLIERVIFELLEALGREWQAGQLNIATEHLATNYLRQRMLLWLHHGPPVYSGAPPVVLACAPGELHEGSLIMLGVLLRRRRWPVAYLGQHMPLGDLAEFVREIQPRVVVLVAMTAETAQALVDWPQHLPEAAQGGPPVVAYGGHIFTTQPEWRARMPGLWLGDTVSAGVELLEKELRKGFS
jgi:DNA-binding transcriptional MerR regulator